MRFIEDGPSIPDALLNARDDGRVVFFCGAGVSRARAGLPDFFGLAEAVLQHLRCSDNSDARKVLNEATAIGKKLSVTGLIAADRVFGLLERDFTRTDIQVAVARCLAPKRLPDLSAHKLLLRLARTPASKTQLVTTNFDRLFQAADRNVPVHLPPRLPNPSRYDDLNGVVYLHGRVNDDYTGPEGNGFVLSSSDFGYAYLSEGSAAEFFRDVVRKYVVVFIGYSADDPPINYLLEGLRRMHERSHGIYSFQADDSDEAVERWKHKGVDAIPYAKAERHHALWQTLECWATRADDPSAWRQNAISVAMAGPENLEPHQRGQVAHIVSTYEGAREFAERAPPAEWLCAFDPLCRYAGSGKSDYFDPDSARIDPFTVYGLDGDATPEKSDSEGRSIVKSPPPGAWDAFALSSADRQGLSDENFPAVRGFFAANVARLPKRVMSLSTWIARIADQPATVWWAVRQEPLHPAIYRGIEWELERQHENVDPVIVKAWRYLLEARKHIEDGPQREAHDLKRQIEREGWTAETLRQFAAIGRPYLSAGPALISKPTPPKLSGNLRVSDLVRLEVVCPIPSHEVAVPDEWLERAIRELRKNIELAVQLCDEVDDTSRLHISPINPDERPEISGFGRTEGLSACVIEFASLFERLAQLDVAKARAEFSAWPADDDTVFSRLRLWATGKPLFATPPEFAAVVNGLTDKAFWSRDHQRDLLLVLAERWPNLPDQSRKDIEGRLLDGPFRFDDEADDEYKKRRAWAILARLRWLADHSCEFSFDVEAAIAQQRVAAPEWRAAYASHAAESREVRGGFVATNTDYAALLHEPLERILPKALELSGRAEENLFEERDPFAGLSANRPVRALRALTNAARRGDYPAWAWRTFLSSPHREKDNPRLSAVIAERVRRLPDGVLVDQLYHITWWLEKAGQSLSNEYPTVFDSITSRIIDLLQHYPSDGGSAVVGTNRGRDWATEALNSPVGHIAVTILEDSRLSAINGAVECSANWLRQLASLFALTGDRRRHAITIASHQLDWLHRCAPDWTEDHLLSILDSDNGDDRDALLAGVFWNPRVTTPRLYKRLKPALLALAKEATARGTHLQTLAYLTLLGWIPIEEKRKERLLSNAELHDLLLRAGDDFRSHILWQIQRALNAQDESTRKVWLASALEFFRDVWPREKAVKTAAMSARLCDVLLSNAESFGTLIDVVLPFLTKIERAVDLHWHLRNDAADIVDKYPEGVLTLLYTVLPDNASDWPYGIGDIIDKLGAIDSALRLDPRLEELKRRWKSM